jgi:hypothetical protein
METINKCYRYTIFRIYGATLKYSFLKISDLDKKNKTEFYMGHKFFGLYRYISNQAIYFPFLRNPIEKAPSHYYCATTNHELQNSGSKKSLCEYLEKDPTLETNNGKASHTAGL